MVVSSGNGDSGNDARLAIKWLRGEALVLIGVFPIAALVLECLTTWRLNTEWTALYIALTTLALVVTGFAKPKR